MPYVHAIYSNSKLPLSPIIRWRTGSKYSHVGIILDPEKQLITGDSLITHSALSCKGVRFTTVKTFIGHATNYQVSQLSQQISDVQYAELLYLAKKYEGLPYDTKGAVGLGVGENWQEDDMFWCSEWFAFLVKMIGMNLQYLNDIHRIAPKHNLDWPQNFLRLDGNCHVIQ